MKYLIKRYRKIYLESFSLRAYNGNRQKKTPNNTKKVRGWSHNRANIKPIIKIPSTGERRIKVCYKFSIPCVAPFVYKNLWAGEC